MKLTAHERDAMVWLGEPVTPEHFVTDAMLRELAAKGVVDYDPVERTAKFTKAGAQVYRDTVGHWPNRNA